MRSMSENVPMTVKRVVSNVTADSVETVRKFYSEWFDLNFVMDHGWIAILASGEAAASRLVLQQKVARGLRFQTCRLRSITLMQSTIVQSYPATISNMS